MWGIATYFLEGPVAPREKIEASSALLVLRVSSSFQLPSRLKHSSLLPSIQNGFRL